MKSQKLEDNIIALLSYIIVGAFFGSIIYLIINYSLFIIGLTALGVGSIFIFGMLIYAHNCGSGCFSGIFLLPGIVLIVLSIPLIVIGLII